MLSDLHNMSLQMNLVPPSSVTISPSRLALELTRLVYFSTLDYLMCSPCSSVVECGNLPEPFPVMRQGTEVQCSELIADIRQY